MPPEILRSRESFPWQKVPAVVPKVCEWLPWENVPACVPKEPACKTPLVPVMIGRVAVVPIDPALVMFPCVCAVGVRASERRESLPRATVLDVVPVGMRARASVPLVMSVAAWVCVEAA